MAWKPVKGWMTPKHDLCIDCDKSVNIYGPGYIVWDRDTGEYRRQHVECKAEYDKRITEFDFQHPPSESPQAA